MSADSIEKIADKLTALSTEIHISGSNGWARQIREIVQQLRALPSLAELERDAGRYRWLRASATVEVLFNDMNEDGSAECYYQYRKDELDSAVDAAMKDQPIDAARAGEAKR